MAFKVIWDNEIDCGEFPQVFATEKEAEQFGEDWLADIIAEDPSPDDDAEEVYSFEVMEIESEPESDGSDEEADWYAELNQGYERDRGLSRHR